MPGWMRMFGVVTLLVLFEVPLGTGLFDPAGPAIAAETALTAEIERLLAAGPAGVGQVEAAAAWQKIVEAGPEALPALLAATARANPVAFNWIVTAADRIVRQARQGGGTLPSEVFLSVIKDRQAPGKTRWMCWQWLNDQDSQHAGALLRECLDDPGAELRRAAVEAALRELGDLNALLNRPGDDTQRRATVAELQKLFAAARDSDQVEMLAQWLRRFGQSVDLARHYGYVQIWRVVGPFDNRGGVGFETTYPPEQRPVISETYAGKHGPVSWKKLTLTDEKGRVNLNELLGEEKGVVAYALTVVELDQDQPVEIRWASPNATKLWVNGRLVAAFDVYHSGYEDDQYRISCQLRQGPNYLLIKICQNEQTQDWARDWEFRLRVCDNLGGGVGKVRDPAELPVSPMPQ